MSIFTKTKKETEKQSPTPAVIKKVDGGYLSFNTHTDYDTWKKQK